MCDLIPVIEDSPGTASHAVRGPSYHARHGWSGRTVTHPRPAGPTQRDDLVRPVRLLGVDGRRDLPDPGDEPAACGRGAEFAAAVEEGAIGDWERWIGDARRAQALVNRLTRHLDLQTRPVEATVWRPIA
jgi:hypothetical protein